MNELNFRTLDLNLLRVFDEVMAERNLTRAAGNLSMTQPAVSNALRRLRDLLGDDLVRRSGYGVEPTPFALGLWPTVREALSQLRHTLSPGLFEPATATQHFVLAMADQPLTLDAFCQARHLLVSFSGRPWGFVDEALAALSLRRQVVLTVNQFFTAGQVVASSDLLTVLPLHFVSMTGQGQALVHRPLPLEMPPVCVDMLWHRQTQGLSPQAWLREMVWRAVALETA